MPLAPLLLSIVMLVVGAAPMPYGYYHLLRITTCLVFAWAAYVALSRRMDVLPWIYGLIAVLFNPIAKVPFPKPIWVAIDIGAAVLLLVTMRHIRQPR